MEVTLLHNPKAGTEEHEEEHLVKGLERAGHRVDYYAIKKKGFVRAFDTLGDAVVVAGGDGTVRKVARRLIGRNVPLTILPLGTANNIARSLGLHDDPQQIIQSMADWRPVKFDVGVARGPWGDEPFFEGAGAGLFPRLMTELKAKAREGVPEAVEAEDSEDPEEGMEAGLRFLQQMLKKFPAQEAAITYDERELKGRYLLLEAMNIPRIGPALELAPGASSSDGLLDVVLIREADRGRLARNLKPGSRKSGAAAFAVHRTRQVRLTCAAVDFHYDDQPWPQPAKTKSHLRQLMAHQIHIEIGIWPGALRVLVPAEHC